MQTTSPNLPTVRPLSPHTSHLEDPTVEIVYVSNAELVRRDPLRVFARRAADVLAKVVR
jgi:hypothetical protein